MASICLDVTSDMAGFSPVDWPVPILLCCSSTRVCNRLSFSPRSVSSMVILRLSSRFIDSNSLIFSHRFLRLSSGSLFDVTVLPP